MNHPSNQLLKITEVAKLLTVSPRTIRRWMKAEGFPKPIEFSGKAHRWWLEDVENWVNARKFSDE